MRILITRPLEDAAPLAEALQSQGHEIVIEPLLSILPIAEVTPDLADIQALLFTSANGVRVFAAKSDRRDLPVFSVGDASAEAARDAGFADVKSASGDVAALADLVIAECDPKAGPLFHGAGTDLAGDLAGRLGEAGFLLRRQALYSAPLAPALSPETIRRLREGAIETVLFFSPRTARHFADLWRKAGGEALPETSALGLSPAILRDIADLGWRSLASAKRPDLPAMLDLVASLADERKPAMIATAPDSERDRIAPRESSQESPRGSPRAGAAFAGLLAGLIGGAAIAATAPYWLPLLPLPSPTSEREAENEALAAETASLKVALEALKNKAAAQDSALTSLSAQLAEKDRLWQSRVADLAATLDKIELTQPSAEDRAALAAILGAIEPLQTRLAALEEKALVAPLDLSPLQEAIDHLESAQAVIQKNMTVLGNADRTFSDWMDEAAPAIAEIQSQMKALQENLTAIETGRGTIAEAADFERRAAMLMGLSELRSALLGDAAFADERDVLAELAKADAKTEADLAPIFVKLAPIADKPALSLGQLQASLPAQAIAEAVEAEAAGSALGAESDWFQGLLDELAKGVTIRPVGEAEGSTPLAHLARAETRLAAGDLAAALGELRALSGKAGAAAAPWIEGAGARLLRDEAARDLGSLLLGRLAAGKGDAATP